MSPHVCTGTDVEGESGSDQGWSAGCEDPPCLGLLRGVDVSSLLAVHELFLVVDRGVDAPVANGLGDDALGVGARLQAQLGGHVGQRAGAYTRPLLSST